MKLLAVADEECAALWDYYQPGRLDGYDMILSCGDLKAEYLSFLVTMARCPVFYVHGNHDESYAKRPPEGCDCIDGKLVIYKGLRILGLGGSFLYSYGNHQFTQQQMTKRLHKLTRAIRLAGGVDIVLTHTAPQGVGDLPDRTHQGFAAFRELLDQYHPQYLLHGHIHLRYSQDAVRVREYAGTQVINCCERYPLEVAPRLDPQRMSWGKRLYARLFAGNLLVLDV